VKSRRYVLAFALMIALAAQAKAQVVLDDHTPCSAAVEAFDSHDKEKMREVVAYIESVFPVEEPSTASTRDIQHSGTPFAIVNRSALKAVLMTHLQLINSLPAMGKGRSILEEGGTTVPFWNLFSLRSMIVANSEACRCL
jgi:hypothetical protein